MKDISVYQIDSAVPMPDGKEKLPLGQLEIGESFVIPIERRNSVASVATIYGKKTGKKFTTRKQDEKTVRVWRAA